jgi:hypothetical protein
MTDKETLKNQLLLAGYSEVAIQTIFDLYGWEA